AAAWPLVVSRGAPAHRLPHRGRGAVRRRIEHRAGGAVTLILASGSPRRRDLLASIGVEFEVIKSDVPEVRAAGESPEEYVARLSREKAAAVAQQQPDRWIVAADTTVYLGDELLEKPADGDHARHLLSAMCDAR